MSENSQEFVVMGNKSLKIETKTVDAHSNGICKMAAKPFFSITGIIYKIKETF